MDRIVNKDNIMVNLEMDKREDIIRFFVERLEKNNRLMDKSDFSRIVLRREEMFSTSIGNMIAIPHGMDQCVKEPTVCFGRLKEPIVWDQRQSDKVSIVVLIAVPLECQDMHIKIISHLVRQFMHDDYTEKLHKLNPDEIYVMLKEGLEDE